MLRLQHRQRGSSGQIGGLNAMPRRVNFDTVQKDYDCALYGALGFSTRCIQTYARGLSAGQISYRLKKAHIRRCDYRDGTSEFAQITLRNVRPTARKALDSMLENLRNGKT